MKKIVRFEHKEGPSVKAIYGDGSEELISLSLIAAAPKLLSTLKLWEPMIEALLPIIEIAHPDKLVKMREAYAHLLELIAKAEGQE